MERVFPAKKGQPFFRKGWMLDLCYFLGQYLLWGSVVYFVLSYFSDWLTGIVPGTFRAMLQSQPIWLQAIEVIILSDLLIYWGHRLQHKVPFLWRFHKVHHSAERLDWLAAHREHPLDSIYTVGLINLPMFIVGFPMEVLAGVIAFRGIWAIYIHSNVRLSIGPLKKIIGSPELHHWHHHLDQNAGNYANISPLMDLLFGTYVCPDYEPEAVGIQEDFPENYIGQLVEPIVGKSYWNRFQDKFKK
jgi:sterol desaturase/sphingolipid hydroxylase (fatty acid hydroxylase superfamily)